MHRKMFQITQSGQLIEVSISESVVTNPDTVLAALKQDVNQPEEPAQQEVSEMDCYYSLGDGVSVFQRQFGGNIKTYGSVMLQKLQFYTEWTLVEENNMHMLIPNDGSEDRVDPGAPLIMDIPEDLIIHFTVGWTHPRDINVLKPHAGIVYQLPELLQGNVMNHYLTAFSRSRNTCVRLPLPNLYGDARLCTGSSFSNAKFRNKRNHWGIVNSIKTRAECWSESGWNLDLLGGRGSRLMNQYRRFIRFNANTGEYMPFTGCRDWGMSTSPVPLEDLYRPWTSNENPTMPEIMPGEENLREGGEEDGPVDEPAFANAVPAGEPVPEREANDAG